MSNSNHLIYKAFGLNISSEHLLPELETGTGKPDVVIRYGKVPEHLENPDFIAVRFEAGKQDFLLRVDGVARFRVKNGCEVIIDKVSGIEDHDVTLFLMGSAMGALLHQRGLLPVHGSAVCRDGEAIIFAGVSGAGKSTLAAAFIKKGYQLLADDISAIMLNEKEEPVVLPGFPQIKLWADALKKLGENPKAYKKIRFGIDKRRLPVHDYFCNAPHRVKAIIVLSSHNGSEKELKKINGTDRFNIIKNQTYRFNYLEGLGQKDQHFNIAVKAANTIPIFRLKRPIKDFDPEKLSDYLLEEILKPV
jgi:hypothetical protein